MVNSIEADTKVWISLGVSKNSRIQVVLYQERIQSCMECDWIIMSGYHVI